MSENMHGASLRLVYEKDLDNRSAIFNEAFRNIIEGASENWASRNKHMVLADELLTETYVNGGDGELIPCDDVNEISDYGASRVASLTRRPRKEKMIIEENGDVKTDGKGTVTTLSFVAHLPKYLCDEIPDFYTDIDEDTGEEDTYSRWVAKDKDVARKYFNDVVDYVAEKVLPGGIDSILGVSIQYSERTPHIHIIADPFAPHPSKPGMLRAEFSRAFGRHSEVKDENGEVKKSRGPDGKMSGYQTGLRKYLIERNWEVDLESDPYSKGEVGGNKTMFGKAQAAVRKAKRMIKRAEQMVKWANEEMAKAEVAEADAIDMVVTYAQKVQEAEEIKAGLIADEHFAKLEANTILQQALERDKLSKARESLLDEMETEVSWYKGIHHRIKMTDEQRARSNARIARSEKLVREYKSADEVPNAYNGAEVEEGEDLQLS